MTIRFASGKEIPVEMHKVRIVQKINLRTVDERRRALEEAGYNTFLLRTRDIFLDMLTDSGVNAMSDNQLAGMMVADDAYAGGESYYRLVDAVKDVLGYQYVLPVHQGRAAEHLIDKVFLKPGQVVPTNYHFTTTRAHIEILGGTMLEIYADEALNTQSTHPFKGNIDLNKLTDVIKRYGPEKIAYVRMEATTNLLGGQPFSLENMRAVREICDKHKLLLVLDGSLVSENAYLIQQREKGCSQKSVAQIVKEMCALADIYYMSARKNASVRGGMIATNNEKYYLQLRDWLPVYEGFLTYGGMSVKEVEAMAIGLREMTAPGSGRLRRRASEVLRGATLRERCAGGDATGWAGLPLGRQALPAPYPADAVSGGSARRCCLFVFRDQNDGTRHDLHRSRQRGQRDPRGLGAHAHCCAQKGLYDLAY
jgi:tyrosine phenol-lyase